MHGDPLPVYGDGRQVRNWLFVEDFCRGIHTVLERGRPGEAYNVGGPDECENIDVVRRILELTGRDESLIEHVTDRPGHDRRYSLSSEKLRDELGWEAGCASTTASRAPVDWYRDNEDWWSPIRSGEYREYYEKQYGRGAGLVASSEDDRIIDAELSNGGGRIRNVAVERADAHRARPAGATALGPVPRTAAAGGRRPGAQRRAAPAADPVHRRRPSSRARYPDGRAMAWPGRGPPSRVTHWEGPRRVRTSPPGPRRGRSSCPPTPPNDFGRPPAERASLVSIGCSVTTHPRSSCAA